MKQNKILISGGNGYIGRYLQSVLAHTDIAASDILCPSSTELDISDYDLARAYFTTHKITQIIHLAARLDNNKEKLFSCNISGLFNLLKCARDFSVKHFIFASGNTVYGSNNGTPFTEETKLDPLPKNDYGLSKYFGELLVKDMLSKTNVKYAIFRIGDVYGPGQKTGELIKAVVSNILNSRPQKLYGIGDRTRDYIYVKDVAGGLAFAAQNRLNGIYNLSTGKGTSVAEIIKTAESLSECRDKTIAVDVADEDHTHVVLDNSKMCQAGFKPAYTFSAGLAEIIEKESKND